MIIYMSQTLAYMASIGMGKEVEEIINNGELIELKTIQYIRYGTNNRNEIL